MVGGLATRPAPAAARGVGVRLGNQAGFVEEFVALEDEFLVPKVVSPNAKATATRWWRARSGLEASSAASVQASRGGRIGRPWAAVPAWPRRSSQGK